MGRAFLFGLFIVYPTYVALVAFPTFRWAFIVVLVLMILGGTYRAFRTELARRQSEARRLGIPYRDYRG